MSKLKEEKYMFLPEVNSKATNVQEYKPDMDVIGNSPCPCCENITIPSNGDALAYICPVCMWEIDLFIKSENEPSNQNHGLTLVEARNNYKKYGAVLERVKVYCREAKD